MSFWGDADDDGGGVEDQADGADQLERPDPHINEHEHPQDFPEVHLIDIDLRSLLNFNPEDFDVNLPEPHEEGTSGTKERELILAGGMGANLSFGKFSTGASLGFYLIINLDSKSKGALFRAGTFASGGMPGGVSAKAPFGAVGLQGSIGPNFTAGYGDARKGFFGLADVVGVSGPGVSVGTVNSPAYKSVTLSEGAGAGITAERTSTISIGEFDSYDLERCAFELNQYIMRGTGY